jgi:hypothetical protein
MGVPYFQMGFRIVLWITTYFLLIAYYYYYSFCTFICILFIFLYDTLMMVTEATITCRWTVIYDKSDIFCCIHSFWVFPRRLNILCRIFGTSCLFRRHRSFKQRIKTFEEGTVCSEIIIFINCNWVVTRWQWLVYMYTKYEIGTKFKSGGLHEKHVVATWKLGNHLSICF